MEPNKESQKINLKYSKFKSMLGISFYMEYQKVSSIYFNEFNRKFLKSINIIIQYLQFLVFMI